MTTLDLYTEQYNLGQGVSGTAFLKIGNQGCSFKSIDTALDYITNNSVQLDRIRVYYIANKHYAGYFERDFSNQTRNE